MERDELGELSNELRAEVSSLVDELRGVNARYEELLEASEREGGERREIEEQTMIWRKKYEAAKTELRNIKGQYTLIPIGERYIDSALSQLPHNCLSDRPSKSKEIICLRRRMELSPTCTSLLSRRLSTIYSLLVGTSPSHLSRECPLISTLQIEGALFCPLCDAQSHQRRQSHRPGRPKRRPAPIFLPPLHRTRTTRLAQIKNERYPQ